MSQLPVHNHLQESRESWPVPVDVDGVLAYALLSLSFLSWPVHRRIIVLFDIVENGRRREVSHSRSMRDSEDDELRREKDIVTPRAT